jgi:hypothetical protein
MDGNEDMCESRREGAIGKSSLSLQSLATTVWHEFSDRLAGVRLNKLSLLRIQTTVWHEFDELLAPVRLSSSMIGV